jgi:hypothetical protein
MMLNVMEKGKMMTMTITIGHRITTTWQGFSSSAIARSGVWRPWMARGGANNMMTWMVAKKRSIEAEGRIMGAPKIIALE